MIIIALCSMLLFFVPFVIGSVVICYRIINYQKSEYYKITHIPYYKMLGDLGRKGEYCTYKYLTQLKGKKRFLFNCYIPADNGTTTEIDVLLIHESGIYVLESKNMSGWIFGTDTQRLWTQSLATGHGAGKARKESFFNPIWQNKKHITWLREYLKEYSPLPLYSYIVFSERCELKKLMLNSKEHVVIKRNHVLSVISANASSVGRLLTEETMKKIYQKIYPLSQASASIKDEHIQNINALKARQNQEKAGSIQNPQKPSAKAELENPVVKICPRCGGKLILRTAAKEPNKGKKFYGCSGYPKCRYIEK